MNKNEIQKDWDTITYIIEKKRRAMRYYFSIGEVMQIREIKKKYSFWNKVSIYFLQNYLWHELKR